jgi:uncharacterized membrane protein YfcA
MAHSLAQVVLLPAVAFVAGAVDAIAGGGGLLTVPALLAVGLPPHLALGTNKGQSCFGTAAALVRYGRHGWVPLRRALAVFPSGVVGALAGAWLQLRVPQGPLRPLVLVLLIFAAVVVAVRPALTPLHASAEPTRGREAMAVAVALLIGGYDGFFGPGTGTFLIVAFSTLLSLPLTQASAEAKVVNLGSNLAALGMFIWHHTVVWPIALPMAAAQVLGGTLGAHWTIRGGERWVRGAVLLVVTGLVCKLLVDVWPR